MSVWLKYLYGIYFKIYGDIDISAFNNWLENNAPGYKSNI